MASLPPISATKKENDVFREDPTVAFPEYWAIFVDKGFQRLIKDMRASYLSGKNRPLLRLTEIGKSIAL